MKSPFFYTAFQKSWLSLDYPTPRHNIRKYRKPSPSKTLDFTRQSQNLVTLLSKSQKAYLSLEIPTSGHNILKIQVTLSFENPSFPWKIPQSGHTIKIVLPGRRLLALGLLPEPRNLPGVGVGIPARNQLGSFPLRLSGHTFDLGAGIRIGGTPATASLARGGTTAAAAEKAAPSAVRVGVVGPGGGPIL